MALADFMQTAAEHCGSAGVQKADFSKFQIECRSYEGNAADPAPVCLVAGYDVSGTVDCN
jgi:hypothetical protein